MENGRRLRESSELDQLGPFLKTLSKWDLANFYLFIKVFLFTPSVKIDQVLIMYQTMLSIEKTMVSKTDIVSVYRKDILIKEEHR